MLQPAVTTIMFMGASRNNNMGITKGKGKSVLVHRSEDNSKFSVMKDLSLQEPEVSNILHTAC